MYEMKNSTTCERESKNWALKQLAQIIWINELKVQGPCTRYLFLYSQRRQNYLFTKKISQNKRDNYEISKRFC